MNLVYIDESGNTGHNLKDTQQPVFLLASLIIPESQWFLLEEKFLNIVRKYFGNPLPHNLEIHAIQLKSGRGPFKNMSLEKQFLFRNEMLDLLVKNKIAVIYRRIIKRKFSKF